VPFEKEDLYEGKVRCTRDGVAWVNELQACTLILLVADARWYEARGTDAEAAIRRDVERLIERVDKGYLDPSDASRLAVLKAELVNVALKLDAAPSDQVDIETRFRIAEQWAVDDDAYRFRLTELFEEMVAQRTLPTRVRSDIAKAALRRALDFDEPEEALRLARLLSTSGPSEYDDAVRALAAEAHLLGGEKWPALSSEPSSSVRRIVNARAQLFDDRAEEAVVTLAGYPELSIPPELAPLLIGTCAEAFARSFDLSALDVLRRFARAQQCGGAWVDLWIARVSLCLQNDVQRASVLLEHLKRAPQPHDVGLLVGDADFKFQRDLFEHEVLRRMEASRESIDAVRKRIAHHRHRYRAAAGWAGIWGGPPDVPSDAYWNRWRFICVHNGFSESDTRRCAHKLEADGRVRGDVSLLKQAALLFEALGDVKSSRELEASMHHGKDPSDSARRVNRPADVHAVTEIVLSASNGPIAHDIAERPLASSLTVRTIFDSGYMGTLLEEARPELVHELRQAAVSSIALTAEPLLASLPLEKAVFIGIDWPHPSATPLSHRARVYRKRRSPPPVTSREKLPSSIEVLVTNPSYQVSRSEMSVSSVRASALEKHGIKCRLRDDYSSAHERALLVAPARFEQDGNSVHLQVVREQLSTTWLSRVFGSSVRVCVLDLGVSENVTTMTRDLMLRNAFASELFEISQLDVLFAISTKHPERSANFQRFAAQLAKLLAGEATPMDVMQGVDRKDAADWALFCDEPFLPIALS
jgi:hypothetical protein